MSSVGPSNPQDLDPFGGDGQELEDGTNIAAGVPFREILFNMRLGPWYVPAQAKGRLTWKDNLTKLRSRFDSFIDQHFTTECYLIQTLIPQIGDYPKQPPGVLPDTISLRLKIAWPTKIRLKRFPSVKLDL